MSKEKQIEEMAKDLQKSEHWYFNDHSVDFELDRKKTAENLYNAGYRKQSEGEWTYGENNTMKCTLCRRRMPKIISARFCPNCGAKMKDGAEQRFFSPKDVRRMTRTEVRDNYQAIVDSMKKWK